MVVYPTSASPPTHDALVQNPGSVLGKQAFLQLLVAQLRNQDPLRPMEDREFIAQLAQLTTLETMQQLGTTVESLLGAQLLNNSLRLLGQEVEARLPDGETVSGTVQALQIEGTDIVLDLGGRTVYLADVVRVGAAGSTTGRASLDPSSLQPVPGGVQQP